MRTLVIDTAGPACSVALFDDERLIAAAHEVIGRGHAEALMPMVARLSPSAPDRILVDVGPGSFTGLRVGLSAAIGLGIGWGVPVAGYGSLSLLAALAFAAEPDAQKIAVVNEGGHGQVFAQAFERPMRPMGEPASLVPDAAEALVAGGWATGNAASRFSSRLIAAELDARRVFLLPPALRALPAQPVYGRGADAQPMAARTGARARA